MGYNKQFVSNVALNANSLSAPQQVLNSEGYAVQLAFSGSTCSFSAQILVSSDPFSNTVAPVNFDTLANSSQTFTTAGTFTYNVNPAEYNWIKLKITDNSSAANNGSISAVINVKGPI